MSRKYTDARLYVSEPVNERKLRSLVQGLGDGINAIEGYQLPAGGITASNLTAMADEGTTPETTSKGTFNTFGYLSAFGNPIVSIYAADGLLTSTWKEVSVADGFSAVPSITLDAPPGMVVGSVVWDGSIRGSTDNPGGLGTGSIVNPTAWWEIGVFLDSRLIARSGKVYLGRQSIEVPFATPTSNETSLIEVRYRGYLGALVDTDGTAGGTLNYRPWSTYGWHLWARHTVG